MSNFKWKVYPNQIQSFCKSIFSDSPYLNAHLSFQCCRIDRGGKEYRESTLGFRVHVTMQFLFIYTILLQFINTAVSEEVMTVGHSMESTCVKDVKSARCSPWNLSGRSVVFVEIPANHSDPVTEAMIPSLINTWLTKIVYVFLYFTFAIMEIKPHRNM